MFFFGCHARFRKASLGGNCGTSFTMFSTYRFCTCVFLSSACALCFIYVLLHVWNIRLWCAFFFFLSAALYRHIWSEAWWTSFSAAAIFWTFLCRSCSFYNVLGLTLRHTVSQFLFRSHPVVKFDILSNFANELRSLLTPETLRRKIRKVLCRNGTSRLEALVLEYAWITHDSQFTPASFRENCFAFGVNEQRKFAIAHSAQYNFHRFHCFDSDQF